MEELGTAAAGDSGFLWAIQAILEWIWHTLILQVGRIALAVQLFLLIPRVYRFGHKDAGRTLLWRSVKCAFEHFCSAALLQLRRRFRRILCTGVSQSHRHNEGYAAIQSSLVFLQEAT